MADIAEEELELVELFEAEEFELAELAATDELEELDEPDEIAGDEVEPPPPPPHAVSINERTNAVTQSDRVRRVVSMSKIQTGNSSRDQ